MTNTDKSKPSRQRTVGDYIVEKRIGAGSFANVYKGFHRQTNLTVAIKQVSREKLNLSQKHQENLESEISIMKTLQHPHIVRLFDVIFCAGGDLAKFIRKHGAIPEVVAKRLALHLVAGLKYLRERNLCHRDYKPLNLLLDSDRADATLKIADFGFARHIPPQSMVATLCGSPLYMAPEILRQAKYGPEVDLWSVGAILYEMVFNKTPYTAPNHIALLKNIESAEIKFPAEMPISAELKHLLSGLLHRQPRQRMTFEEFFGHPFWALPNPNGTGPRVSSADPSGQPAQPTDSEARGALASRSSLTVPTTETETTLPTRRALTQMATPRAIVMSAQTLTIGDASYQTAGGLQRLSVSMSKEEATVTATTTTTATATAATHTSQSGSGSEWPLDPDRWSRAYLEALNVAQLQQLCTHYAVSAGTLSKSALIARMLVVVNSHAYRSMHTSNSRPRIESPLAQPVQNADDVLPDAAPLPVSTVGTVSPVADSLPISDSRSSTESLLRNKNDQDRLYDPSWTVLPSPAEAVQSGTAKAVLLRKSDLTRSIDPNYVLLHTAPMVAAHGSRGTAVPVTSMQSSLIRQHGVIKQLPSIAEEDNVLTPLHRMRKRAELVAECGDAYAVSAGQLPPVDMEPGLCTSPGSWAAPLVLYVWALRLFRATVVAAGECKCTASVLGWTDKLEALRQQLQQGFAVTMDKAERLRQRLTQQAVVVRVSSKLSDSVRTLTENELGQIDCAERLLYVWALELLQQGALDEMRALNTAATEKYLRAYRVFEYLSQQDGADDHDKSLLQQLCADAMARVARLAPLVASSGSSDMG